MFRFLDSVVGFHEGEPIYRRGCLQIISPGAECPQKLYYDGRAYDSDKDFLPLPQALLDTDAGRELLTDRPNGLKIDLPCLIGTTRGVPESPSGRYVVVGSDLIDLQAGTTTCAQDSMWWTAMDDNGQGWGRLREQPRFGCLTTPVPGRSPPAKCPLQRRRWPSLTTVKRSSD